MELLTKQEALEILGTTERQLQRYSAQGKLSVALIQGKSGKKEAHYNKDEIEEIRKTKFQATIKPQIVTTPDMSPTTRHPTQVAPPLFPNVTPDFIELLKETFAFPAPLRPSELKEKPLLNLREATTLSGLPISRLRQAIHTKELLGSKIGNTLLIDTQDLLSYCHAIVRGQTRKVGNE